MVDGAFITDEMINLISKEFGPYVYEVEKGAIRKVAEAIGDPNPLWQNEEYAKRSRYGGIIASPTFFFSLRFDEIAQLLTELECPLRESMNAGSEIEYFQPIRPGDVITVKAKVTDIREREGRSGKMLFVPVDLTYENQKGELVLKHRFNFLRY